VAVVELELSESMELTALLETVVMVLRLRLVDHL
jgi:hypothetical protein